MARSPLQFIALLAGLTALVAFFFLPWLTLSTPVINILQVGVDARTLIQWAPMLPGGYLTSLWLVPISGGLLSLNSVVALRSVSTNGNGTGGVWQLLLGIGLLLPIIAVIYTYSTTLDTLKKLIPLPVSLPVEAVLYLGIGFYVAAVAAVVLIVVAVINMR